MKTNDEVFVLVKSGEMTFEEFLCFKYDYAYQEGFDAGYDTYNED